MKWNSLTLWAISLIWISFVPALHADPSASIEIVGVKLTGKNQVTVETEVRNLSNENIKIDPRISFRMANLQGEYYDNSQHDDSVGQGTFKVKITTYHDLTTVLPNGSPVLLNLNFKTAENYPPPPLVLMPGDRKNISLVIPEVNQLLQKDIMIALSKGVWMRAELYPPGGAPTSEEEQELVTQHKLLTPKEYEQAREKLLSKYATIKAFMYDNLYKLEKPKEGETSKGLTLLKVPL